MIPNCLGCKCELEEGIKYLKKDLDVVFEGFGERKHLFIIVFDKKENIILG